MDARIALPSQGTVVTQSAVQPYVVETTDFEEMYLREYPGLYAVAAALAGVDNGEDLVQDTMFKALINWPRVRGLERPGGWCHRVLVNFCRSFWRRRRLEDRFAARYASRAGTISGPSADVVAFWTAVRRLPSRPRLTVALYYAADYSAGEIASILDVPEGTVRSDLARARGALAAELRG